jgi:hypothetical protein
VCTRLTSAPVAVDLSSTDDVGMLAAHGAPLAIHRVLSSSGEELCTCSQQERTTFLMNFFSSPHKKEDEATNGPSPLLYSGDSSRGAGGEGGVTVTAGG